MPLLPGTQSWSLSHVPPLAALCHRPERAGGWSVIGQVWGWVSPLVMSACLPSNEPPLASAVWGAGQKDQEFYRLVCKCSWDHPVYDV